MVFRDRKGRKNSKGSEKEKLARFFVWREVLVDDLNLCEDCFVFVFF